VELESLFTAIEVLLTFSIGSRKRSNFQALWRNSFWSGVEQRRRLLVGDGVYVGLMGCFVV